MRSKAAAALLALAAALAAPACRAGSLEFCDRAATPSAEQNDVLLRFGAIVKSTLAASGHDVALIARSGTDLHRIHVRYSHEGVALDDGAGPAWRVRELYYSCDDHQPRVYDEGLAGFLLGTDDPETGWVSIVLMPPQASDTLRRTALDKRQALGVLGSTYSANAYPFSTQRQNCNQWVIELLATAWAPAEDENTDATPGSDTARSRAQRWLYRQGYRPTVFEVSARPMMWLADVLPWMSNADHPAAELAADRYSVSMPDSVEIFVDAKVPGASRIELCHAGRHVVVHHGWDAIADGCVAGPADEQFELGRD